ncbi:hypothetical protein [Streptomyces sp. NPDC047973]|uniref:hypothetical protein n=1 Tax=Streptomyces sp. NPDC047973 TaxID=3155383 RepID=UPI003422FC75
MRSREFDLDFRHRAGKTRNWGLALLALATLLWAWCAVLILLPYEVDRKPDDQYPAECESRLFTDRGTANEGRGQGVYCADERDWPEALAVLGLSLPVSLAGVALFTVGTVSRRMSGHSQAMRELDGLADAAERRAPSGN